MRTRWAYTLYIYVIMLLCAVESSAQQGYAFRAAGIASYYHDSLHGNFMAGGGRYDRDSLTCAHLHFPFGTILRVRNCVNGREIEVKVTDRGPFSNRFVIDLSRRAAEELGIIGAAFTPVTLTPVGRIVVPFRYVKSWEQEENERREAERILLHPLRATGLLKIEPKYGSGGCETIGKKPAVLSHVPNCVHSADAIELEPIQDLIHVAEAGGAWQGRLEHTLTIDHKK